MDTPRPSLVDVLVQARVQILVFTILITAGLLLFYLAFISQQLHPRLILAIIGMGMVGYSAYCVWQKLRLGTEQPSLLQSLPLAALWGILLTLGTLQTYPAYFALKPEQVNLFSTLLPLLMMPITIWPAVWNHQFPPRYRTLPWVVGIVYILFFSWTIWRFIHA